MQFDNAELALLSRRGSVPRPSRARPSETPTRDHNRVWRRVVSMTRRRAAATRSYRARVVATGGASGEGRRDG